MRSLLAAATFLLMHAVANQEMDGRGRLAKLVAGGVSVKEVMEGLWLAADEVLTITSPLNVALRFLNLATRMDGGENLSLHLALSNRLLRMGHSTKALMRFSLILISMRRKLRASGDSCSDNASLCALVHGHIGACYMELRNFSSAASHFRTSLSLWPHDDSVAWQLALAAEYGGDWPGAVDAYRHWLNLQRSGRRWQLAAGGAALRQRTVAIFCLFRLPDSQGGRWGPSSVERQGIGGSEEAVILLSRELVRLGWHVEVNRVPPPLLQWSEAATRAARPHALRGHGRSRVVARAQTSRSSAAAARRRQVYGHPADSELGRDRHGVFWLPVHAYPHQPVAARRRGPPAVFVSWRCYALAALGGPGALNYLWRASPPATRARAAMRLSDRRL